jgi:hypothetical protein
VRGFLPWLRELFLGPPKPQCDVAGCHNGPTPACGAGLCAFHHSLHCCYHEPSGPRCASKVRVLHIHEGGQQ